MLKNKLNKAFTLIELLIVVAIIGILSAIALPNFLNAQTKALIARTESEMSTLKFAIESYRIDQGVYPLDGNDYNPPIIQKFQQKYIQYVLTTPIAYISKIPIDPFHLDHYEEERDPTLRLLFTDPPYPYLYFTYFGYDEHGGQPYSYSFFSFCADNDFDNARTDRDSLVIYDPSNGLTSNGDIHRSGP